MLDATLSHEMCPLLSWWISLSKLDNPVGLEESFPYRLGVGNSVSKPHRVIDSFGTTLAGEVVVFRRWIVVTGNYPFIGFGQVVNRERSPTIVNPEVALTTCIREHHGSIKDGTILANPLHLDALIIELDNLCNGEKLLSLDFCPIQNGKEIASIVLQDFWKHLVCL
jgi:hypothetical protein